MSLRVVQPVAMMMHSGTPEANGCGVLLAFAATHARTLIAAGGAARPGARAARSRNMSFLLAWKVASGVARGVILMIGRLSARRSDFSLALSPHSRAADGNGPARPWDAFRARPGSGARREQGRKRAKQQEVGRSLQTACVTSQRLPRAAGRHGGRRCWAPEAITFRRLAIPSPRSRWKMLLLRTCCRRATGRNLGLQPAVPVPALAVRHCPTTGRVLTAWRLAHASFQEMSSARA